MVIVYATTKYVSRYFPALDTILTFPVVYQYSVGDRYNFNMTNDTNDDSTQSNGVIIQRRPSVIQEVPKQKITVDERECEVIDVVGDGLKEVEEEGVKRKRKRNSSSEVGVRRTRRKRTGMMENKAEDVEWNSLEKKRHKCSECGMRFKKPSALVIHARTHSGEKPFQCELCDKRFSISGNLRRHMFTHTGEKPYRCQACGRAFNNPSHLARHSKKIHI